MDPHSVHTRRFAKNAFLIMYSCPKLVCAASQILTELKCFLKFTNCSRNIEMSRSQPLFIWQLRVYRSVKENPVDEFSLIQYQCAARKEVIH